MNANRLVATILGLNLLVVLLAVSAWLGLEILPHLQTRLALRAEVMLDVTGAIALWSLLGTAEPCASKRLKSWTDLFWNVWSYFGVCCLASAVITGRDDLKQVVPGSCAGELVPIIAGVMLNAVVRVA